MSFSVHGSNVVLCTGDNVVTYNLETKTQRTSTLPNLATEKDVKVHNNEDIDSFHTLTSVSSSASGEYTLVCANRKQLCVFKTKSLELVSNRTLVRAASRVCFLPNNDIVVADKSGDVYLYCALESDDKGQLLLGHLSMLLDVLVTSDQKYVITADRDEKIRVSLFPNSYNILSYCLGHKNFVTNLAILPHDKSTLVSCGGDGCLMFWDFQSGRELLTTYFHEKLSQEDLTRLNKTLKENNLMDQVTVSPVKHLQLLQVNGEKSIICLTFYCSKRLLTYSVVGERNKVTVEHLQSITLDREPLECKSSSNRLWILTDKGIQAHKFTETGLIVDSEMDSKIADLNETWQKLHDASTTTLLPILYKRRFDTVQEYQERKKLRLNS